jgi:hypothetical protein
MSDTSPPVEQLPIPDMYTWVQCLPDGAVSVDIEGATLVLRASHTLQDRFDWQFITLYHRPCTAPVCWGLGCGR